MDRLVQTIYALLEALYPLIQTVATKPTRPWTERNRLATRFWILFRELQALPLRITPNILSPTPTFRSSPRPGTEPRAVAPRRQGVTRLPTPPYHSTPYTARQLAIRLVKLLHQLELLALEATTTLTPKIRRIARKARTLAGCHALPPPHPTWEQTG